ncbi:hypothetical protein MMAD_54720 [Mycolicibacterium madagascariense]|uniref:Transmembrane protein n=1 Tax=Mycolicibacterium madagascariense TaxID=212765 RepID=A0A7I7XPJ5_9MYCO|nr:hypothetical protein [Mycolicibacterium madagascariense]MCV7014135.1 hypothetical protein [Mycolicibacterium madagascariense]BBZ31177.1 hypothetical protein MMAD_54720 [Mycolicibacterium madagascariense]
MLIAAVLCLCAALVSAATGFWSLARRQPTDGVARVLRAVVPTQLAAAVMLGAGGVVALIAPHQAGVVAVAVSVLGAVGTVAAGCYQSAKLVADSEAAASAGCAGSCASCTLSCG